jgi:hypothetical protein
VKRAIGIAVFNADDRVMVMGLLVGIQLQHTIHQHPQRARKLVEWCAVDALGVDRLDQIQRALRHALLQVSPQQCVLLLQMGAVLAHQLQLLALPGAQGRVGHADLGAGRLKIPTQRIQPPQRRHFVAQTIAFVHQPSPS